MNPIVGIHEIDRFDIGHFFQNVFNSAIACATGPGILSENDVDIRMRCCIKREAIKNLAARITVHRNYDLRTEYRFRRQQSFQRLKCQRRVAVERHCDDNQILGSIVHSQPL